MLAKSCSIAAETSSKYKRLCNSEIQVRASTLFHDSLGWMHLKLFQSNDINICAIFFLFIKARTSPFSRNTSPWPKHLSPSFEAKASANHIYHVITVPKYENFLHTKSKTG